MVKPCFLGIAASTAFLPALASASIDYEAELFLEEAGIDTSYENLSRLVFEDDVDLMVRQMSAFVIADSNDPTAYSILSALASHHDSQAQVAAIKALGRLSDARVVPFLTDFLLTDNPETHKQVALSALLRNRPHAEIESELEQIATSPNQYESLKASAVDVMFHSESDTARKLFERFRTDDSLVVRTKATMALALKNPKYQGDLVGLIQQQDLPDHLWIDVLAILERVSGQDFELDPGRSDVRDIAQKRQETVDEVTRWWGEESPPSRCARAR